MASSYEPPSVPGEAYLRDRRRLMRAAPAAIALVLLFMCGVIALLVNRRRTIERL
jgi:hypothetical protein